jgi:hypothetical protein
MLKKLFLIPLLILLFAGCSKDDDINNSNENTNINPNFPLWGFLKVGHQWEYETTYFDSNGAVLQSIKYELLIVDKEVYTDRREVYFEKEHYQLYPLYTIYPPNTSSYSQITYKAFEFGDWIIPFNYKLGDEVFNSYEHKFIGKITSTNKPIITSIGTFNCIEIEYKEDDGRISYIYFCPRYGEIAYNKNRLLGLNEALAYRSETKLISKNF